MSGPSPEHRAFVEAGIGICMAVIMADGVYSEAEMALFVKAQHRYDLFRDVPPDAFNPMLARVRARLQAESWKTLVTEWAKAVPELHRTALYELAVDMATADRSVSGKEPEVLKHLAESFGLWSEDANRILLERLGL